MAPDDSTSLRRCTKCDTDKPTDQFKVLSNRGGALGRWCRVCARTYQRERYARVNPPDNSEFESHFAATGLEWRPVSGFACYRVGNDGSVWSCFRSTGDGSGKAPSQVWSRLSPERGKKGHMRATLYLPGAGSARVLVHHLVLRAFIGPRPDGMEGCHGDGDPTNNRLGNLRWDTQQGNWEDRRKHGRARAWSKLTPADVVVLRALLAGGVTAADAASLFEISDTQARNIGAGRQWKEVG